MSTEEPTTATRVDELVDVLDSGDSLAVICHDNPDPDCIASALALREIAVHQGFDDVAVFYAGEVSHQQNRAFVNLLAVAMERFDAEALEEYDLVGFVDHSVKGANNRVADDIDVDIVIDHHPSENGVDARFVDIREDYGATTTMLVEYLRALDVELYENLATAMLFAIRSETLDFVRDVTDKEYEAAQYLHGRADLDTLRQMARPAFTPQTLDTIGQAIMNREIRASSLIAGVGRTTERDALPQAADYLMNLEGVATVLVFGIIDGEIHISARSSDSRVNLDRVVRDAFGDVGSAGGHQGMAGAQVPLGIFSDMTESDDELIDLSNEIIKKRFFDAMNLAPDDEDEEE